MTTDERLDLIAGQLARIEQTQTHDRDLTLSNFRILKERLSKIEERLNEMDTKLKLLSRR